MPWYVSAADTLGSAQHRRPCSLPRLCQWDHPRVVCCLRPGSHPPIYPEPFPLSADRDVKQHMRRIVNAVAADHLPRRVFNLRHIKFRCGHTRLEARVALISLV